MKNKVFQGILFTLFIMTSLGSSYAQVRMLTREEAYADVDSLLYTISEVHPNMFSVCKQSELFSFIDKEVYSTMPDSISSVELYKKLAPFVTKIGDGHTALYFPFNSVFTKELQRMPLYMHVTTDHKLFAISSLDNLIPYDSEIIAINGKSSKEMVKAMLAYESGEKEFFRTERLNKTMTALFELLFKADKYDVTYRLKGSRKKFTVTLPTVDFETMNARMSTPPLEQKEYKPYSFTIDKKKSVAIMEFNSMENTGEMIHFVDSMFTTLKENNVKKLIIDIRNNGGGSSRAGDAVLRYISPSPFNQMGKNIIRNTPTTKRLTKNSAPVGWYYYDNMDKKERMITPLTKEQGHFDGKVYLLTSHKTFSAAASFSWAFKYFGIGTVIGEETGGMNVSFGEFLRYKLPNSGLQCGISFKRFWHYGADESDIHGTLPDIAVPAEKAMKVALKK